MNTDDLHWEDYPDWSTLDWSTLVDRDGTRYIRLYNPSLYPQWTVRLGFGEKPVNRIQIDPDLTLDEAKDFCRVLARTQT